MAAAVAAARTAACCLRFFEDDFDLLASAAAVAAAAAAAASPFSWRSSAAWRFASLEFGLSLFHSKSFDARRIVYVDTFRLRYSLIFGAVMSRLSRVTSPIRLISSGVSFLLRPERGLSFIDLVSMYFLRKVEIDLRETFLVIWFLLIYVYMICFIKIQKVNFMDITQV